MEHSLRNIAPSLGKCAGSSELARSSPWPRQSFSLVEWERQKQCTNYNIKIITRFFLEDVFWGTTWLNAISEESRVVYRRCCLYLLDGTCTTAWQWRLKDRSQSSLLTSICWKLQRELFVGTSTSSTLTILNSWKTVLRFVEVFLILTFLILDCVFTLFSDENHERIRQRNNGTDFRLRGRWRLLSQCIIARKDRCIERAAALRSCSGWSHFSEVL